MIVAARLSCAPHVRPAGGGKNGATSPPPTSPQLPPIPEPPPPSAPGPGRERAAAGRPRYRIAVWGAIAAAIVLGLYFYFAYARGLVPVRAGA